MLFNYKYGEKEFRSILIDCINNPQDHEEHLKSLYKLQYKFLTSNIILNCCVQLIYVLESSPLTEDEVFELVELPSIKNLDTLFCQLCSLSMSTLLRQHSRMERLDCVS